MTQHPDEAAVRLGERAAHPSTGEEYVRCPECGGVWHVSAVLLQPTPGGGVEVAGRLSTARCLNCHHVHQIPATPTPEESR